MSGHSKWANIKHKKARQDEKKNRIFSKISKEIVAAAKRGGGDPNNNLQLRIAIQKAKDANMPLDNIERAIQRATGELAGVNYEELVYEGYGPGGAAVLMNILTDNRNRTAGEIRHIFAKNGGNLGETGCVGWMFDKKGSIVIEAGSVPDGDQLILDALEAGAEDVVEEEEYYVVSTAPENLSTVREALEGAGYKIESAEEAMQPQSIVSLSGKQAEQMIRLLEALEDHDDVQNVYSNFDIPDEEMERLNA